LADGCRRRYSAALTLPRPTKFIHRRWRERRAAVGLLLLPWPASRRAAEQQRKQSARTAPHRKLCSQESFGVNGLLILGRLHHMENVTKVCESALCGIFSFRDKPRPWRALDAPTGPLLRHAFTRQLSESLAPSLSAIDTTSTEPRAHDATMQPTSVQPQKIGVPRWQRAYAARLAQAPLHLKARLLGGLLRRLLLLRLLLLLLRLSLLRRRRRRRERFGFQLLPPLRVPVGK